MLGWKGRFSAIPGAPWVMTFDQQAPCRDERQPDLELSSSQITDSVGSSCSVNTSVTASGDRSKPRAAFGGSGLEQFMIPLRAHRGTGPYDKEGADTAKAP